MLLPYVHTPLLLGSLDLALWTSIFVNATSDLEKSVGNLGKKSHDRLADLLIEDEIEAICMEGLSMKLELALKTVNEDTLESVSFCDPVHLLSSKSGHNNVTHPLLAKLRIFPAKMTSLEDFSDNIQSSQTEKHKNSLVNTKGHLVPLKPPRCIELMVAEYHHKMWAVGNTNLLAPVTVQMWKTWVGLTNFDSDNLKNLLLNNVGVLRAPLRLGT